jgi:DNA-binding transcriptional ArsR family regulator
VNPLRSPFAPGFTADAAYDLHVAVKRLASPHRLTILAALHQRPMTNVELEALLPAIKQVTVVHHLHVLTAAGLIDTRREGAHRIRSLVPGRMAEIAAVLDPARVALADPRPDCPDEFHGADGGACRTCGWDSHPIPGGAE